MSGELKTGTAQRQSTKNLQISFFFNGFLYPTLRIKREHPFSFTSYFEYLSTQSKPGWSYSCFLLPDFLGWSSLMSKNRGSHLAHHSYDFLIASNPDGFERMKTGEGSNKDLTHSCFFHHFIFPTSMPDAKSVVPEIPWRCVFPSFAQECVCAFSYYASSQFLIRAGFF